jgi:site-specific recombinase XerD
MTPWNKGKAVGQKTPFTPEQISKIKEIMLKNDDLAGLALFSCAIDSMLRSSDITKLKVGDVLDFEGNANRRIILMQEKTKKKVKKPHKITFFESTAEYLQNYLAVARKSEQDYCFTATGRKTAMTRRTYANYVKRWAAMVGLDCKKYATHSCRRSNAVVMYKKTKDLNLLKNLLGHASIASTQHYIDDGREEALDQYESVISEKAQK